MNPIAAENLISTIEYIAKNGEPPKTLLHIFALDCAKTCIQLYQTRFGLCGWLSQLAESIAFKDTWLQGEQSKETLKPAYDKADTLFNITHKALTSAWLLCGFFMPPVFKLEYLLARTVRDALDYSALTSAATTSFSARDFFACFQASAKIDSFRSCQTASLENQDCLFDLDFLCNLELERQAEILTSLIADYERYKQQKDELEEVLFETP